MKDAQLAPSENSLTKECGWKDGDTGGPAPTKKPLIRKRKNRLDTNRPSHGRIWRTISPSKVSALMLRWGHGITVLGMGNMLGLQKGRGDGGREELGLIYISRC